MPYLFEHTKEEMMFCFIFFWFLWYVILVDFFTWDLPRGIRKSRLESALLISIRLLIFSHPFLLNLTIWNWSLFEHFHMCFWLTLWFVLKCEITTHLTMMYFNGVQLFNARVLPNIKVQLDISDENFYCTAIGVPNKSYYQRWDIINLMVLPSL